MTVQQVPDSALRRWLDALGWEPEQLARRLNAFARRQRVKCTISEKAPYHWLKGACPRQPLPGLVAALLTEATGQRVTLADLGWRTPAAGVLALADDGLNELWTPGRAVDVLDLVVRSDPMGASRRQFLVISGMALAAAANQWIIDTDRLAAAAAGHRIDIGIADDLDRIVDAKRRVDDALGGGILYQSVREELRFVIDLLRNGSYSEAVGKRLYGAATELARLAGWARFDSGDTGGAQRYFLVALRSAQLSGNRALGAHVLGFMGVQATLAGDPKDAVMLLKSAHEGGRAVMTATEQAALFGRLSRAYGKDHDQYHADASAEHAFELLAQSRPDNDPPWIYWCNEADMSGMIGEGYVALGDTDQAGRYLETAVSGLDASRPRDRVIWMTSLAAAQLRTHQRDQALAQARAAAEAAAVLNSDRIVGYIGDFRRELGPGTSDPEIVGFDDYLRSAFPGRLHSLLGVA